MVKAVFTTRASPSYDDLPERYYHFPRSYLRQVEAALGDWIVYYEPRRRSADPGSRGGRQAYFAIARVAGIEPDPVRPDHFYARIDGYLDLEHPVPFRAGPGDTYERSLTRQDGGTSKGAFGRAVRNLSDAEFDRIVTAGFGRLIAPPVTISPAAAPFDGFGEAPAVFEDAPTPPRPMIERLVTRPFRDRAFADVVRRAYGRRCAMTGLALVDADGLGEAEAAHIRPVADDGPDSVRNGLALTGTLHWMFDHGLVSVDEDHGLLLDQGRVPDTILRIIHPDRRLVVPDIPDLRPHPEFLRYHRREIFRG